MKRFLLVEKCVINYTGNAKEYYVVEDRYEDRTIRTILKG